jgi:serine/threonine protein kinase/Flp pilus assembly protein TadD
MSNASVQEDVSLESLVAQLVDDFRKRQQGGEQPDVEAYAARHPQAADVLRKVLASLQLLALTASGVAVEAAATPDGPVARILGDFRLVREVGRGGMGVVYEAEQLSLGRRVALKILPFAAALDPKQLQRFKNEAQAAAHLHHTNIVPVHAVGCERGVHYYAMQYIEGQTLAAVIRELQRNVKCRMTNDERMTNDQCQNPNENSAAADARTNNRDSTFGFLSSLGIGHSSFFRTVANLGVQAAEALEHAHQLGVVHRDIKPANLLVEWRAGGVNPGVNPPVLWITDFGLAHCQSQAGLTMTGDVVGTLRYMSPEQALARRASVDHRTDIYSLGVTLYELLTLEVAFPGRDREEVLRRIAFEEPPAPRHQNQAIPKELDTIILKAMEKSPEARYATAQELADDLRRFLEDKPIRAKRPTLVQRAAKWGRRHKAAMRAALVVLLLAVAGLIASTWFIWREKEQTKTALAEARSNADRAQQNLDSAYTILDEIYVNTAEKRLPREKELTPEDRQFLEKTLTFYEKVASQNSSDPDVRLKTAQAYRRVAGIRERLGQTQQAAAAYQQALAVSAELAAEFPNQPDYRQNLARSYSSLGGVFLNSLPSPPLPEIERAYAEALQLQEELVREFPANLDYQHDLGFTYFHVGYMHIFLRGTPAEAEEPLRRALAIREKLVEERPSVFSYRQELGMSLGVLFNLLTETNRYQRAQEVVLRALKVRQKVVEDFPAEPEARHYLADGYANLATFWKRTGKLQEEAEALRQEISLRKKLAAEFPGLMLNLSKLACSSVALGNALRNSGAHDEAIAAYEEAIRASKEFLHRKPDDAYVYLFWGQAVAGMGAPDEAATTWMQAVQLGAEHAGVANRMAWFLATGPEPRIQPPEKAVELAQKAVALAPQNANYRNTLGAAYYRAGQWQDAVSALKSAMRLRSGGDSGDWFFLAMAHWQLGDAEKARHFYDQAVGWMEKNKPQDEELGRFRGEAAALLGIEEEPLKKQSAISQQRSAEKISTR